MTRILVVEDDVDIRDALAALLREVGFEPSCAANGRDALDLLRTAPAPPDVIVLDLVMPVRDGWQLAADLRGDPAWAAIPIVLLSAGDDLDLHAREIGADAQLRKPIDINELVATLSRLPARARLNATRDATRRAAS